jgi:hypothetical protein
MIFAGILYVTFIFVCLGCETDPTTFSYTQPQPKPQDRYQATETVLAETPAMPKIEKPMTRHRQWNERVLIVTSEPSNAKVYITKNRPIGMTPLETTTSEAPKVDVYAELDDKHEIMFEELTGSDPRKIHFIFEEEYSAQIEKIRGDIPKDYLKGIVRVFGKYEIAKTSPRNLAPAAFSEVKSSYEELKIEFMEVKAPPLDKAFKCLLKKIDDIMVILSVNAYALEGMIVPERIKAADIYVDKIRKGLGLVD